MRRQTDEEDCESENLDYVNEMSFRKDREEEEEVDDDDEEENGEDGDEE